jgi:ATP-binding cassette subfamily C protein CydC
MTHGQVLVRLLRFMKPMNGVMVVSILARIVKLLMQAALIAFAAASVARYVSAPEPDTLWWIGGMLTMYAFLLGLSNYVETYTGHYVAFRLLAMLRNEFYDKMEPQAPAGTTALRSGDAVSRVVNDWERVEPFYAHTIAPVITAVIVPTLLLFYLARYYHPDFAWTLLPFLLLTCIALPILTAWLGRGGEDDWREAQGDVNAFLTDSLQGLRDTLAFAGGERRRQLAWQLGQRLQRGQHRLTRADSIQRAISQLAIAGAAVAMLWTGARLLDAGEITDPLRNLAVVVAVALTSFYAANSLNNVVNDYKVAIASARRLFEMMEAPVRVTDLTKTPVVGSNASIEFDNVTFAYGGPGSAPVLNRISFKIDSGQHVALVGTSGVGKTTISNLMLRFWDTDAGTIRIGGHAVKDYPLDDLRSRIAVVSQRNYIFNDSIGANIRMGKSGATDAEIDQAVRRAGLKAWIDSLPDGLDTRCGEMGSKISGGQRQRVAIARAFLKDAPILVLDEATSNLDAETERAVNQAVRELAAGRTVLTIAHRLSTVRNAEEVLVVDNGQIVERGTHDSLLRQNGTYARIFELQQDEVDTQWQTV